MTAAGTIESRLALVEARFALQDLALQYCRAMDAMDWDALAPLFAVEGRFAGGRTRDQIVERLRAARGGHGRTVHTPTGQLLEFSSPERATGSVPTIGLLDINGETVSAAMTYDDEYVVEDGRWRFARRRIRYQYALPWSQLSESMSAPDPVRWPGQPPAAPAEP